MRNRFHAALLLGLMAATLAGQANAAAFAAWKVTGIPFGDTLNIRKYPASVSQKQAAYPNGAILQMTGRCTGGVDLLDIAGSSRDGSTESISRRVEQIDTERFVRASGVYE